MTFLQSLILGIIQGLTEFLPISSSAHLVLAPFLFGWEFPEQQVFPFGVLVQTGTLMAVIIYFWKDLRKIIKSFVLGLIHRKPFASQESRLGWCLILATIPAGLAGLFLKPLVADAFLNPKLTAYFLFGTASLLLAAEFFSRQDRQAHTLTWMDALWVGLFQAISIFPGISRSGATIAGGMIRNLDRPSAARFAFLMSIPVMLGSAVYSLPELLAVPKLGSFLPILLLGFVAAGVVGFFSIKWLLSFVNQRSLVYFAAYCVVLATLVLIVGNSRNRMDAIYLIPAETQEVQTVEPSSNTGSGSVIPSGDEIQLNVQYTAALEWLTPAMSTCADNTPGFTLITQQVAGNQFAPIKSSILIRWGEPAELSTYATQLGIESLAFITNPENTLQFLPLEFARRIAVGLYPSWKMVFEDCPECFTAPPGVEIEMEPPQLYVYLPGEESQSLFESVVLTKAYVLNPNAVLVPSPLAMRQIISESNAGLGLLPETFVNGSIKVIKIEGVDPVQLTKPILAIADEEPQENTAAWLTCLRDSLIP